MSNLSNIEIFNSKYLDSTPTPQVPQVVYDMSAILDHANVLYKKDKKKGFMPYHYKCRHCKSKTTRNIEQFIKHLEGCKGLTDGD